MSKKYKHKIPWFKSAHDCIEGRDEIWNYWMIKEYVELVNSGNQLVSTSIHQLFDYIYNRVLAGEVYLDVELTEQSYYQPRKHFPHDLYEWERFLLPFIFGLRNKDDDSLVFNEFFLYMARGGGKNYFMAWVIFACMGNLNGIQHYDVAVSAASERQAKRSFSDISEVVKTNEALKKSFRVTEKKIIHNRTLSEFIYLSSNGQTMDGQRLGLAYLDEIHAIKEYAALKVMRSSLGKIPDKRLFITSTDGYVRGKVLDDQKEKSLMILNGERGVDFPLDDVKHHLKLFPFMHHVDSEEEVRTLEGWQKANPSVLYNPDLLQTYREEVAEIDINPELNIEFHLKRANFVKEDTRFAVATYDEIQQTKTRDLDYYKKEYGLVQVSGSVDYSMTRDLTSVELVGRFGNEFYIKHHSFITHDSYYSGLINSDLLEQAREDGKLTIVQDKLINEQDVVRWFQEQLDLDWIIDEIYIDQFKSAVLGKALEDAGFIVTRVATNMMKETLVSPLVDRAFVNHELFVGDDALFRWAVGNVFKQVRAKGIQYDKIDPVRRKTDPFSAWVNYLIGTVGDQETNENGYFVGQVT